VRNLARSGRLKQGRRLTAGWIIGAFCLGLLPFLPAGTSARAETAPQAATDAARAVLANPALQTTFPGAKPPAAPEVEKPDLAPKSSPPPPPPKIDAAPPAPPPSVADQGGGFDIGQLLLVAAVIGLVIVLLYLLTRAKSAAPEIVPKAVAAEVAARPADPAPPPSPIEEAERLAALGRYSEAIHAILLRLLHDLRLAGGPAPATSTTSREILRETGLPERFKAGLSVLVGAVELCHFGGRAADQRLFQHCAEAYFAAVARAENSSPQVSA
jgi:hypothetical protein